MNGKNMIIRIDLQDIYALTIASLPILGLYGFLGFSFGLGVVLISFTGLISVFFFVNSRNKGMSILPILITYLYFIIRKQGQYTDQLLLIMALINITGFCYSGLNSSKIKKFILYIAMLNVLLVIIQTVLHYSVGYNMSFINESFLKDGVNAGTFGGTLFRPSGLFLEPAHFSEYCLMALVSLLFPEEEKKPNLMTAFFISIGCLLTTSGIGIFYVAAIWGWFVLFTKRKSGTRILYLLLWSILGLIIIVILIQIPFFRLAIQRVFGKVDGYNAINGRLWAWDSVIGKMEGAVLIWGYGSSAFFKGYMTGLMQIIVQYGLAGVVIFTIPFIYCSIHARTNYVILSSLTYCSLMIVANLSSVYSMVFYSGIVLADTIRILKEKSSVRIHEK